jgi:hypothetical protein
MTTMQNTAIASSTGWVLSLTMTFMPRMDDDAVTGRVTAAITARRSAAIVNCVFTRLVELDGGLQVLLLTIRHGA